MMDIHEILAVLPHRHPFLLIDRVLELDPGKSVVAIKNISINDPFFQGHFPGRPVMPGVLILESLAQACGILAITILANYSPKTSVIYLAGVDNVRFKQVVEPGDQMQLNVELVRHKADIIKFTGSAYVNAKLACAAKLTCARSDIK